MDKPKCMTDEDFEAWGILNNRILKVAEFASTPCLDCTAEYQREMMAQDRCSTPDWPIRERLPLPKVVDGMSERRRYFRLREIAALTMINAGASQWEASLELDVSDSVVNKWVKRARERKGGA